MPSFADLALVDDDGVGGFGGTIGAQTFNGQSESFVELDNGAFFEPGTPTLLNGLESTYQNTPFGTFTPTVDYPGGFPADVLAYLESKFYHFRDDDTLGLFFFPVLPEIDQEDIFNTFGEFDPGLGGLDVSLLQLPSIPGASGAGGPPAPTGPAALNNIATAAGGNGAPSTPEELNALETAAGGDTTGTSGNTVSCWGDAAGNAGSGAVTVSFGGSAEDILNSETSCGS